MYKLLLTYGLLLLLCNNYWLQAQTSITVTPDKATIYSNEKITVKYSLTYTETDAKYYLKPTADWNMVTAPNFTKKSLSIKGKAYTEEVITYTLLPISTGKLPLPNMTLIEKGVRYTTPNTYVQIATYGKANNTNATMLPATVEQKMPTKSIDWDKLLYIKRIVTNHKPYVGEPFLVTYYLYRVVQTNAKIVQQPVFEAMNIKELTTDEAPTYETINNKLHRVDILRKVQLVLWQQQQTIDGIKVNNIVSVKDGQNQIVNINKQIALPPITIQANTLANSMNPEMELFGNFSIEASLAKNSMAKQENNTLYLTISGAGNWDKLIKPTILWPSQLKLYNTTVNDTLAETTFLQPGSRTFAYQFIAEENGTVSIPPIEVMYHEMGTGIKKKTATKTLMVNINGLLNSKQIAANKYEAANHKNMLWIVVALIVIVGIGLYIRYKKEPKNNEASSLKILKPTTVAKVLPNLNEIKNPNEALLAGKQRIKKYLEQEIATENICLDDLITKYSIVNKADADAITTVISSINEYLYGNQLLSEEQLKNLIDEIRKITR